MKELLHTLKMRVFEPIGRRLAIHPKRVIPLFSAALGYRVDGEFTQHGEDHNTVDDLVVHRRLWGGHIAFGGSHTRSLYYNGALFIRLNWPPGLFISIRWAGDDPSKPEFVQIGIGWKLNGDFAATFRIGSDESRAAGVTGPNQGQAVGWAEGTK